MTHQQYEDEAERLGLLFASGRNRTADAMRAGIHKAIMNYAKING